MKLAQPVKNFIDKDTAEYHVSLMESKRHLMNPRDCQAPKSLSSYGINWELLEANHLQMEDITGLELSPAYEYSRIYSVGETLEKHKDRPSCEVSVTVCLKNVGEPWEFFWEGGSFMMEQGDAVVYRGCEVEHWREENPDNVVYQSFLHYVDMNGPYADRANEYLKRMPEWVLDAQGKPHRRSNR